MRRETFREETPPRPRGRKAAFALENSCESSIIKRLRIPKSLRNFRSATRSRRRDIPAGEERKQTNASWAWTIARCGEDGGRHALSAPAAIASEV